MQNNEKFKEYFESLCSEAITEEELLELYSHTIKITYNNHVYTMPFDAASYNGITQLIQNYEKENN